MKDKKKAKSIGDVIAYSKKSKGSLVLGIFLVCIGMILSISPVLAVYKIIEILFSGDGINGGLINHALFGLTAMLVGYLFTYVGSLFCHKFSYDLIAEVKKKLIKHIGSLPLGYFTGDNKAKIRQVLGSDMNQIEGYFSHSLPNLLSTLVLILIMFVIMFKINVLLALVSLVAIVIGFGIQLGIMVKIIKSGGLAENFKILDNINSATSEYVRGMPEVKAFGNANQSFKTFSDAVMEYKSFTSSMTAMIRSGFVSFRVFILSVATFIVPLGIFLLSKNRGSIEYIITFVFFLIIGPAISIPVLKLRDFAEGVNMLNEVIARLYKIIEEKEMPQGSFSGNLTNYDIEFEHVDFAYGDEEVLKDLSFKTEQGKVTALVGPSGAGKSTIGTLIPRFYDVFSGSIKIGGVDIRDMKLDDLMKEVSFVFQDNDLINDTVFNNIAMAQKNATKEQVIGAAKKARCHDFIINLENGYNTVLGKGLYLSGGEKQRMAIARAILKNSPILVLDEATSFADSENEYLIQEALSELVKNKTVIMIAHRLNTIKNAHQILVIDDGKIAEQGTHDELMEEDGMYANMFRVSNEANAWHMGNERRV